MKKHLFSAALITLLSQAVLAETAEEKGLRMRTRSR